ncbi:Alpha carbonic anhydrase [Rhynchospora pubera]|uniref:Carbonic anhydrase n=1 Tax=Rhynchospora pubera TaxID=906938 RepID=A0AAV8G7B0_9POAL|nr:Alpha carbonic anhydrase [Rhynchospora pubera]KAJ4812601.1 Alpha carbonic anhydrase [Rhynchospora pubera]
MTMKTILFSTFLTISLLFSIPLVSSQEVEDESEFSYVPGTENGPEHWGELNENWTMCGTGHQQSPIDLLNERVQVNPNLGRLIRSYRPANATMKNRGHDIELKWHEDAGTIQIDGYYYLLTQLHWHSPSEHTINGKRYEMEMHMVHQTSDGKKIAVIGFLYEYGHPDPFLAEMEPYIKEVGNLKDEEESVGIVDPRKIKLGSRKYYRYIGSLTTPPCTEGVTWTIVKKIRTVSREQLHLLKDAVHDEAHDNARPIQSIYDRMINMYRPQKIQN